MHITAQITAQDILDLLPIVADRGWQVCPDGYIRDRDGRCPICSLCNEVAGTDEFEAISTAMNKAGFTPRSSGAAADIARAADSALEPLRPALMRALGMKP